MSNTTNTIIAAAVAAVNEDLNQDLLAKATPLVVRINSLQLGIVDLQKQIADHRKSLAELAGSKVDDSFLRGVESGESKTTVQKVIDKMNADRQASVEVAAKNLTTCIDSLQARIDAEDKRIAELRKQLLEIKPRVVTEPEIVG